MEDKTNYLDKLYVMQMSKRFDNNVCDNCGQDKTESNNCLQCEYETNMLFI